MVLGPSPAVSGQFGMDAPKELSGGTAVQALSDGAGGSGEFFTRYATTATLSLALRFKTTVERWAHTASPSIVMSPKGMSGPLARRETMVMLLPMLLEAMTWNW